MKDYTQSLICKELQQVKKNYDTPITIVPGLKFNQRALIRMIEFYSNSKYLNGQKDELDRDKPFYNIVNAMCDVENAAKDLDTADITATSDDGNSYTESFLIIKELHEWMKATNFAKTLNDMRDAHTRYGSLLVKKHVKKDKNGERQISIEIPEWKNTITDQVNILNGTIIECHYMWPSEILAMKEWYNVDEAIAKYASKDFYHRLPVYEVRGMFPKSFNKELMGKKPTKADHRDYSYQLFYLLGEYVDNQAVEANDLFYFAGSMIPVYWEDNTERVYKHLARKKKSGRAFGCGVIEEGEEAQVWTNDAVLKQFRAMEYTSKVIGQTASKKLKGRNILNEVDDGQILEHEDNKPITALTLLPAGGLNQYGNLINQWFTQYERATSAYSAQRGESPTSRTSFKLQAAVISQSSSVLESLQEDLGIFVTEIFEDWILPFQAKKLNTEHILSHNFNIEELKEIDRNFSTHHANKRMKEMILSGKVVTPEEYAAFYQEADQSVKRTKDTRFLAVPKDYYKDVVSKVTIHITNERRNKKAVLESLSNIMMVYAKNPEIVNDPALTQIFMKIVELSGAGISPASLVSAFREQAQVNEQRKQQEQEMQMQQQMQQAAPQMPEAPIA